MAQEPGGLDSFAQGLDGADREPVVQESQGERQAGFSRTERRPDAGTRAETWPPLGGIHAEGNGSGSGPGSLARPSSPITMRTAPLLLCAPLVLSLCGLARAASPCAPTDPRTVIDAVNTPGSADATFRILNPGSYYLDQNLVGEAGKVGIRVEASNVRID